MQRLSLHFGLSDRGDVDRNAPDPSWSPFPRDLRMPGGGDPSQADVREHHSVLDREIFHVIHGILNRLLRIGPIIGVDAVEYVLKRNASRRRKTKK